MKLMLLRLAVVASLAGILRAADAVEIVDADYEGREQFKISVPGATWYYDKAGGGFSRLIDREGRDWISFHKTPLKEFPAGAAAGFRGLPNVVFGKDNPDSGAGHPGFDQCESVRVAPNAIQTTSKSGRWSWRWEFFGTHAVFTLERVDAERPWWFLYEGTPAGRYAPREQYWGTNLGGPRTETPNHNAKGDSTGQWRWIYFGDQTASRVLFAAQPVADEATDVFSYLGSTAAGLAAPDGMVVFGFGRTGSRPMLRGAGARFVVGFVEEAVPDATAHARVAQKIELLLHP